MKKEGYILFNNKNSYRDIGAKIVDKIIIPFPKRKVDKIEIPGGEDLYVDMGGYEDITIPIELDILDKRQIKNKYRDIKRWLGIINDNHLLFWDDLDYFYKVKKVELPNDFETMFSLNGTAVINFICDPYLYVVDGEEEIKLPPRLQNEYGIVANPTYRIKGEGVIKIRINKGEFVEFNVGQEIIVDVDRKIIYRNGFIENIRKKGAWEGLQLSPGENLIDYRVADEARLDEITIIPNWRTL